MFKPGDISLDELNIEIYYKKSGKWHFIWEIEPGKFDLIRFTPTYEVQICTSFRRRK